MVTTTPNIREIEKLLHRYFHLTPSTRDARCKNPKKPYVINPTTGAVTVFGDVASTFEFGETVEHFPFHFAEVSGRFEVPGSKKLKSLAGAPKRCAEFSSWDIGLDCSNCPELVDLTGPEIVYIGFKSVNCPSLDTSKPLPFITKEWQLGTLDGTVPPLEIPCGPYPGRLNMRSYAISDKPSRGLTQLLLHVLECATQEKLFQVWMTMLGDGKGPIWEPLLHVATRGDLFQLMSEYEALMGVPLIAEPLAEPDSPAGPVW